MHLKKCDDALLSGFHDLSRCALSLFISTNDRCMSTAFRLHESQVEWVSEIVELHHKVEYIWKCILATAVLTCILLWWQIYFMFCCVSGGTAHTS
mmetsp:Transcript_30638/g.57099  ORF Transcript_30638/g.57099 Transcript_30638/m.57099 type:complete len:95 (-) Transcript_30638:2589-2873(-)